MNYKALSSRRHRWARVFTLALPAVLLVACAEFVDVDTPKNEITGSVVYTNDATATAAVVGIYTKMSEAFYFNSVGIPMATGLTADEFVGDVLFGNGFEANQLDPDADPLRTILWQPGYKYVYQANAALEGLENSQGVSAPVRRSLRGQAYFVRALCYFYLVNLFGDLPKVVGTDYELNAVLPREPVDSIYGLINRDLAQAMALLPRDFETAYQGERTVPTTWAAHALQARVALYRGQWARAEREADSVILQGQFFQLPALDGAFNHDTEEAIWQIKPVYISLGSVTQEATSFIEAQYVYVRPEFLDALEPGDERAQWIGAIPVDDTTFLYYPYKYRYLFPEEGIEYHIEFRLAEQYLIRAEARTHLGNFDGAVADLDAVRERAGLPKLAEMGITWTQDLLLDRIMQERRIELFSEGHRWFDLIRTGRAEAVLTDIDGKIWEDTDILYPVPGGEIRKNRSLEPQNEGY